METKGKIYDDSEFQAKEKFVKGDFKKHNPQFRYVKFMEEKAGAGFTEFFEVLQKEIANL